MAPLLAVDELIELGDAVLWRDRELLGPMRAAAETPYRPGRERLARALREIRRGSASPGETRTRLLLVRAGIREPELNADVHLPNEVVHPDMVWRDRMVALEYEGDGHREREQFEYDIGRYERMQAAGWTVVRVISSDLQGAKATALIRRIKAVLG